MNMKTEFRREDNWILPVKGTIGNKSRNLRNNLQVINECEMSVPFSMSIPPEYINSVEGPLYYILDWIQKNFSHCKAVAVRSDSPDEDVGGRDPGRYVSVKINHHDRQDSYMPVERVLQSYYSRKAIERRKKFRIKEKGMGLLVQEFKPATRSGCFSDIGELALLTFANPKEEMDAMLKPSLFKYWVDVQGYIKGERSLNTYTEHIAEIFRELVGALPKLDKKGWEIEFIESGSNFYVVQTTPIEKKPRFEVSDSKKSIFHSYDILGTGEFKTKGILYVPRGFNADLVSDFDSKNSDYCLAATHSHFTNPVMTKRSNLIDLAQNAAVIIDINPEDLMSQPFSAHVEQFMREGRAALVGRFEGRLGKILIDPKDTVNSVEEGKTRVSYSPTCLITRVDEVERKATIELAGKIEPFVKF